MMSWSSESITDEPLRSSEPLRLRFGIGSLLWLTGIVSMVAAYVKSLGEFELTMGLFTFFVCCSIGVLWGIYDGAKAERFFWAMVAGVLMQIATFNVLLMHRTGMIAWPVIASMTAALIADGRGHLLSRMFVAAFSASLYYSVYMLLLRMPIATMWPEAVCAPIGGALLPVLMAICQRLSQRWQVSLMLIATLLIGLMIVVVVLGKRYVPGW